MLESELDVSFWPYAVNTAAYIANRSPVKNSKVTPVEILTNRKPDIGRFRIFGCLAFSHIPKQFRGKFHPKSRKCIMVGYTITCYELWCPSTNKIIFARNVVFDESKNFAVWTDDEKNDSSERLFTIDGDYDYFRLEREGEEQRRDENLACECVDMEGEQTGDENLVSGGR